MIKNFWVEDSRKDENALLFAYSKIAWASLILNEDEVYWSIIHDVCYDQDNGVWIIYE